ncbi:cell envelope integrity protein TolA [Photorhabdus bodei]|uniref:cell envelope integrity protein TolA n=1 Tax=Photorhabdus bodei TaxID=2029681 RepID=UPI001E53D59C|nr:cell envelope integrity protein TolA [Photorhabdus bodei]MCC8463866.1 cell envelope integrity protein TolA [Photorhabdus bodei]
MSDKNELVVIEKQNALSVFTNNDAIEMIINQIESEVKRIVPDLTTVKGRKEIASLAYKVSQTKSYIDNIGKDLVAEYKEIPRKIDASRKQIRDKLDALRDEVRQPLTDWEAEQERIAREKEARIAAEELAKRVEVDHEIALLMNEKFDRDFAEKKAELERQRLAREEEIKQRAAEQARIDAERKALAEIEAAARREAEAKAAAERAEREKLEALERAEREKQAAIEAERRKAAAAEQARLAEIQRQKDEEKQRRADIDHRKRINNESLQELIKAGIPKECAMNCIKAIAAGKTSHLKIIY